MEENMYRFGVDADIGSATDKLNKIVELMDTIDGLNKKGKDNYFHSSQKDIDTNVKAMREMIRLSKGLERQLQSIKSLQASKGDFGGVMQLNKYIKDVQNNLDQTRRKFEQLGDNKQSTSWLNNSVLKDQQRHNKDLSEEIKKLKEIKNLTRELSAAERRVKSRTNNYSSAGKATYNQTQVLKGDMNTLSTASSMKADNNVRIGSLNSQIGEIDQALASLAKNTAKNDQERINEETALKNTRKTLESTIHAFQEMNYTINHFDETLKQANNKMSDVNVAADPSSFKGQLSSRSNSIGIALVGSMLGAFGGLYAKGETANKAMREPSIRAGQVTGNSDFRSVRKHVQDEGLTDGINYKGGDMFAFQDSVLSSMGFKGQKSLDDTTMELAKGSRATPVDKESLSDFLEGTMRSGSVESASDVKDIQAAFLGAIEQSGMVGREKEQLDALNSIDKQVFSGRNGDKDELNNLVALQTLFSEKGGKALQGENGGKVLNSLDSGIRGAVDDPTLSLIFGRGTKYQGKDGKFKLREKLDAGISDADNLKTMMNYANAQQGGMATDDAKKEYFTDLASKMGANLRPDEVTGIFNSTNGFKDMSDETLQKIAEKNKNLGDEKYDKNSEDYKNSAEALADRSEASTEKKATDLNSNELTDIVRKTNILLAKLPAPLYALTLALGAVAGTSLLSGGMPAVSQLIKKFTTKKAPEILKDTAETVGKGSGGFWGKTSKKIKGFFGKGGGEAVESAGKGGFFSRATSKVKGFFGKGGATATEAGAEGLSTASKSGGFFSNLAEKAKGIFNGGTEIAKDAKTGAYKVGKGLEETGGFSKFLEGAGETIGGVGKTAGKFLGKAGKVAGKIAPWLAVGDAVLDVATSDDKVKSVGENGGMLAGMWGGGELGASVGASIGSVVPGAGTAIGGVVGGVAGGIGGAFAGSKLGGTIIDAGRGAWDWTKNAAGGAWDWTKDKLGGFFGGDKADAAELDNSDNKKSENKSKRQDEKDTTNKKSQAEKLREKNSMRDDANLSLYSKLLDRGKELLSKSKAQNGLFGNSKNKSGSSDSKGSDVGSTPEYSDWADAVKKASDQMQANASDAEMQKVLKLIQTESSGNEGVVNDWDINAQNGNPSKGLLQYIQTTFDAYKVKGHEDINSGYDQILAFFNNSNWKDDLASWEKRMANGTTGWGPTGSKRFAMGGHVTSPTQALIGEVSGQDEYVINPKQPTAPGLLQEAMAKTKQNFNLLGDSNDTLLSAMTGITKGGSSKSQEFNTNNTINVNVNGVENVNSAKKVGNQVADAVSEGLNSAMEFFSKELRRA